MDANDWNHRYEAAELLWSTTPNVLIEQELSDLTAGRALDLAAGEGRNAIWLAERGWKVKAVDFSWVAVQRARRLAQHRKVEIEWVQTDLLVWSPEPISYDLVLIAYLHLPWEQMRTVLHRASQSIAVGGRFFLVGHDLDNLEHGTGGPSDPAVLCGPEKIAAELPGLEIEKAVRVHRAVESEHSTEIAIDHIVKAIYPVENSE